MSDHMAKLVGQFRNLVGQCPMTDCYFQHCCWFTLCTSFTSQEHYLALNLPINLTGTQDTQPNSYCLPEGKRFLCYVTKGALVFCLLLLFGNWYGLMIVTYNSKVLTYFFLLIMLPLSTLLLSFPLLIHRISIAYKVHQIIYAFKLETHNVC